LTCFVPLEQTENQQSHMINQSSSQIVFHKKVNTYVKKLHSLVHTNLVVLSIKNICIDINIPGWRTVNLVLLFHALAGLTEGGNVDGLY